LINKNTLFLELQEFADNCKNKKKYRIKNSEAAHNIKIMEAIVKSSKKNKKNIFVNLLINISSNRWNNNYS
jgi:hypothetical protein